MALTDVAVRSAKPREKDYKLADGGGLYLLVTPAGGKLWRLKYRVHGVERKLALARYPEVSLSEARKARDAARESASAGEDPSAQRRRERIAARTAIGTTFGDVAQEYIEKAQREGRAEATLVKLRWMREWLLPAVGLLTYESSWDQSLDRGAVQVPAVTGGRYRALHIFPLGELVSRVYVEDGLGDDHNRKASASASPDGRP